MIVVPLFSSVTQTNDLGGSSLRWRDLYARDIDARNGILSGTLSATGQVDLGQLRITGNKIESDVTNADITLDANGTGTINVSANKITNVTVSRQHKMPQQRHMLMQLYPQQTK